MGVAALRRAGESPTNASKLVPSRLSDLSRSPLILGLAGLVLFCALGLFAFIVRAEVSTDIQLHLGFIEKMRETNAPVPPNLLFYWIVDVSSAWLGLQLWIPAICLLALMVAARNLLTSWFLQDVSRRTNTGALAPVREPVIVLLSAALTVSFSLPTTSWYLGQLPPNVWHNSTTVLLMPFALLLFAAVDDYLRTPRLATILSMVLLVLLNVLAKPSYFFVFAMCFPLMCIRRFGIRRDALLGALPVLAGGALVAAQYLFLYGGENEASVALRPLHVWSNYSPNILWSIAASTLFPMTCTLLYWKELKTSLTYQYAALCLIAGIAMMALLSETVEREFDGNFFWQAYVANYLLFLVCASHLLVAFQRDGFEGLRIRLATAAFALHAAAGTAYLLRILLIKEWR